MKFYCDVEGLEANWIDVSEKWTRKEYLTLQESEPDKFLPLLIGKITAMHLATEDGTVLSEPSQLTDDVIDNLDARLLGFIGGIATNAFVRLRTLGNAKARLWSERAEATQPRLLN